VEELRKSELSVSQNIDLGPETDPRIVNTSTAKLKDLFFRYLTTFFQIYKLLGIE
jgi:hypothetical protein